MTVFLTQNRNEITSYKGEWRVSESSFEKGEKVISQRPHEYIKPEDLPKEFDWRDHKGRNYLSWSRNQNSPNYCGAWWADSVVSSIADRIMIGRKASELTLALNPQVIVNWKAGGTCSGGNPAQVYEYINKFGVPDSTCMVYEGKDSNKTCDPFDVCRDWTGPAKQLNETNFDNCWTIEKPKKYFVKEYGYVSGINNMKAEIYARGPISCGIMSTGKFSNYERGIFSEFSFWATPNHEVSIVGWGVSDDGTEYWIGRNNWGTYWGEKGFFKIRMNYFNLGINNDCTWGVPVTDEQEQKEYELRLEEEKVRFYKY